MKQIECVGGPHDGKRMPLRGMTWRIQRLPAPPKPEEPWRPPPAAVAPGASGTYLLTKGCYCWQADP